MIIPEKGCAFEDWVKTRKAIIEFIEEQGFSVDQAIEILKLQELEFINDNIKDQVEQLEGLNENLDNVTAKSRYGDFIRIGGTVLCEK